MMDWLNRVALSEGVHKGSAVIWIEFPYDKSLIAELKRLGARWSASEKRWHLPDTAANRELLGLQAPPLVGKEVLSRIDPKNHDALRRMEVTLTLKGYSRSTMRTYCIELAQLLYLLGKYPVEKLTPERLRSYILYCIAELKLSENLVHSRLNAIKFYFEQVLGREKFMVDIPRPKKPSTLPKVLSAADVKKLFAVTDNDKHRLILQLCYGMGLRVSEIVALEMADIDSKRMQVHIRRGKGKKDRYVPLPQTVLQSLRTYYKAYRPQRFLFEGVDGGPYSVRSAQAVFRNAMDRAGIRKKIGIHGLRHSYATRLLEFGTDIGLIRELIHN